MDKATLDTFWLLLCSGLIVLMQGGFFCLYYGLNCTKGNLNSVFKYLVVFVISLLLYWAFGFGVMFDASKESGIRFNGFFSDITQMTAKQNSFLLFQMMLCSIATTFVFGAVAERMRPEGYITISVLISILIYPVYGHWAWNSLIGGDAAWLANKGFVDFAGSTVVHSTGGWVALAALLVMSPRTGYFSGNATEKMPATNLPLAVVGLMLLALGWLGLNGGSTFAMDAKLLTVIANTLLAAGASVVSAVLLGWFMTDKSDVELVGNGIMAGMVSISASTFAVNSLAAIGIGFMGGIVMVVGIWLLKRSKIDDVIGVVPVHLCAGIWGTLAVALFGEPDLLGTGIDFQAQLQAQIIGIVSCFIWGFGLPYLLLNIINALMPLRVSLLYEKRGLSLSEYDAKTIVQDLFATLEQQIKNTDLSLRVPVKQQFTELGKIAECYNQWMETVAHSIYELEGKVEAYSSEVQKVKADFRAILDNTAEAILSIDAEQKVVSFNATAESFFGYSADEVLNKSVTVLIPELLTHFYLTGRKGSSHLLNDSGSIVTHDKTFGLRKDGNKLPLEIDISQVLLNNKLFHFIFLRDIRKRILVEQKSQMLSTAVEQSPVSVLITNAKGIIEYVNARFYEISGYSDKDNIVGKSSSILNSSKIDITTYKNMMETITLGANWTGQLLNQKKNGEIYWVKSYIFIIKNINGKILNYISIDEDITTQKSLGEERNDAFQVIRSSIQYASRIQRSILPSHELIKVLLPDYFVLWKPRDVVGGDMYWCKPWGTGVLVMLGDCTGHGVPGAFMTLIANGALEQTLKVVKVGDTARLTEHLHHIIQELLGQDVEYGDSDDGLDLGACYIPSECDRLTFTGANFSLFHQDVDGEVIELKGDKRGVGYRNLPNKTPAPFNNQEVNILPKRRFILATDGIFDQIGSVSGHSFGKKRFICALKEQQNLPLSEVGLNLYDELEKYQGKSKRRDDVSILGFTF